MQSSASHFKRRLDRQRLRLAFIVTLMPLAGTIAAIVLWINGLPPGALGLSLLVLMYAAAIVGLEVGYHRMLTHRAFVARPKLRLALAILGSMAFEGPVIWWVAVHRRHHGLTDRPGDPHSPNLAGKGAWGVAKGLVHAHIGWMFRADCTGPALVENFPRDLQREPAILRINKHYFRWVMLGFAIPTIVGGVLSRSWEGALIGLLWGGFVRVFLTSQFSFALNSLTHVPIGRRSLETVGDDRSRDNWLLVIPTFGQGYHNRHHACPSAAILGTHWWHFDLGGWIIAALEKLDWVSEAGRIDPEWLRARRIPSSSTSNLGSEQSR
ncbi:fatty acid desaturase [Trinickia sp. LjRoot230]|uniref:acyl-CoA desaturase n=1 Tax=Trinickia sp. LjRoot230 TaxID=3342288 RepID=UPI003ECF47ED